jgi:glutamyl-tRNA reductase
MTIVSLSLSHRTASAEVLETLVVPAPELGDVLARLHAVSSIDEALHAGSLRSADRDGQPAAARF